MVLKLIPGGSPIIHKESTGSSGLVSVSKNPFVTTLAPLREFGLQSPPGDSRPSGVSFI